MEDSPGRSRATDGAGLLGAQRVPAEALREQDQVSAPTTLLLLFLLLCLLRRIRLGCGCFIGTESQSCLKRAVWDFGCLGWREVLVRGRSWVFILALCSGATAGSAQ